MLKAGGPTGPEALQQAFGKRVVAIGRVLPMLEPWDDPGYVKRAWCLFELYTAIQRRDEVTIDVILSPKQARSFRDRINADGTDARAVDEALAHVKSENAEASVQADLDAIRALIKNYSGGFGTLNDTVKTYLRRWFVSQGGVQVAARPGRAATDPGPRHPARQGPVRVERVHVAHFAGSVSPARSGDSVTTSTSTAAAAATAATATTTNKAAGDPAVAMFVSNPAYDVSEAYEHEDMWDPGAIVTMPRSNHRDNGADDGGYMEVEVEVEGTSRRAGRLESDVSLITDTGLGRQGSGIPPLDLADPGIVQRRLSATSEL